MVLRRLQSLDSDATPLEQAELPIPEPSAGEVLIKVSACGVCHTELDEIEGRTPPPRLPIVLGHEVVGVVNLCGSDVTRLTAGERVGVGWIHSSSGDERENISERFTATGRDVNGGYAQFMTVPEDYAYPVPERYSDAEAAPLMCAGAIGYRALKLAGLQDGEGLGLVGFGASAHLVLQLVRHLLPRSPVYVFARDAAQRDFARELGAAWSGDLRDASPAKPHAIIDTTPAWTPVVEGLAKLRPGGRLVINAIRKEDADKNALMNLSYAEHLWLEREIKTVANITRYDIAEFLPLAAAAGVTPAVETYRLEEANQALVDLRRGRNRGAKVLLVS